MAELFVANGVCGGTVFFLPSGPILVGRTSDAQITIADPWISALHARLELRGDQRWVVDLGSRNGTFVNDQRVQAAPLLPGDRLRLGKTAAEYRVGAKASRSLAREGTILRPVAEVGGATLPPAEMRRVTDTDVQVARRQLAAMNAIGKALVEATGFQVTLERLLEPVAAAVRAETSALLLLDEHGELTVRAALPRDFAPRISRTLLDEAVQSRWGVVTVDAQTDERFGQGDSVIAHGLRSCLYSPLWAENRAVGVLVMDRGAVDPFTPEDLDLVTAVGYQATLAIERSRFLEQARQVEEQRQKLLRHFSPEVANLVLSSEQLDRDPLAVSTRDEVTVLFSDIRGFTGLTERLPPLELAALLRDYFRVMTDAVFAQKGTLDKFIGDGLMAVFGAPVAQPDGALRAVRCARAMLERLTELNRNLPADRQIHIRIGINTGRVLAGNFGSPERVEFTVLGDTVNVAARLETLAEPDTVLLGARTAEQVKDEVELSALGPVELKGRQQRMDVFKVERWRSSGRS